MKATKVPTIDVPPPPPPPDFVAAEDALKCALDALAIYNACAFANAKAAIKALALGPDMVKPDMVFGAFIALKEQLKNPAFAAKVSELGAAYFATEATAEALKLQKSKSRKPKKASAAENPPTDGSAPKSAAGPIGETASASAPDVSGSAGDAAAAGPERPMGFEREQSAALAEAPDPSATVSDFDGAAPVFYDPQSSAQTGDGSVAVETGSGDQCAATERNPASGSAPPPDVSDISDIAPTAAEMTPVEEPNALDDNGKPAPADESFASGPSGEFGGATPSEDERGSEADRVATTPAEKDVVSSAISSRFRLQKPRRLVNPGNAIPTVEAAEPRAAAGIERDTVPTS